VPSSFVALDALLLLPNGKVDRRALPAAKPRRLEAERPFVAPRTPAEHTLAKIWADVLDIEQVGIEDNFFDLGGHSLLTMRLCHQIEKTFGKRLPLAAILQAPTVAQLAAILGQDGGSTPMSPLVALQPTGSKPPFFWVHGENSNAFLPRYLGPDQPVYGLLQQSRDGTPARYTRLEDIAAYYLSEIRQVQSRGPFFLGGFCIGGTLAFEMAQQLRRQGEEVALLALLDPPNPSSGEFFQAFHAPVSTFMPDTHRFSTWVSRHLQTVSRLAPPERLTYVYDRISGTMRKPLRKFIDTAEKLVCSVYVLTGTMHTIPPSLRIPYINAVHRRARRWYVPQVYPGRMVVLTTEWRGDARVAWERLAAGGLEVHEVPGRHAEIVLEQSQIQGLATRLRACLDRAQQLHEAHLERYQVRSAS